jgi:hypothetical protein
MLRLDEWLRLVGFREGQNPFAQIEADEEREWLQAYFVEHPSFNAMSETHLLSSSILHAKRGAGKSTSCYMLEEQYRLQASTLRPLIVSFKSWDELTPYMEDSVANLRDHYIRLLLRHIVVALADSCMQPWVQLPADARYVQLFHWLCQEYGDYLRFTQQDTLIRQGFLSSAPHDAEREKIGKRMEDLPALRRLEWVVEALRATQYQHCLVLADRVDELPLTMGDPQNGAALLLPLVGTLPLLEMPYLVHKLFLPSEIVDVLKQSNALRHDRPRSFELYWDGPEGRKLLERMLKNRLDFFSDGMITSLSALATPDLRQTIDTHVVDAVEGSPRSLLLLGDRLFKICAETASSNELSITAEHLAKAMEDLPEILAARDLPTPAPAQSEAPPVPVAEQAPPPTNEPEPRIAPDGVPLLSIEADESICRGGVPIDGWQQLSNLQRKVLRYLYERSDTICKREKLAVDIWKDTAVGDDTIRKFMNRLINFIEEDPQNPRYIEKIRGGHYCMRYTVRRGDSTQQRDESNPSET